MRKLHLQASNLADLKNEFELYLYLKDGIELCRMIGLVTQGQVLEGITYRCQPFPTGKFN